MKVIFEETKGKLTENGCHFKLYGRSMDHNEPYNLPYLLLKQVSVHGETDDQVWSVIKAIGNADAIRQTIKQIDGTVIREGVAA